MQHVTRAASEPAPHGTRPSQETSNAGGGDYKELNTASILDKFGWVIVPLYLALGTGAYCALEPKWTAIDSIYFCCVCLTTVGYGDLSPSSNASKAFTIGYVLIGLSLVATSLGSLVGRLQSSLSRRDAVPTSPARQLCLSALTLFLIFSVGATFFHFSENKDWFDCIYWAVITCTSIGFGDFSPMKQSDRLAAVFYLLLAVGLFASTLGR